jgi:hypothetical protein
MAGGVDLVRIDVVDTESNYTTLEIKVGIKAENEFEALLWLISRLNEDS